MIYIQNEDDLSVPEEYMVKLPRSQSGDSNMIEEHINLEVTDDQGEEIEELQDQKVFVQKRQRLEDALELEEEQLTESYTIEEKDEGLQFSRAYETGENVAVQQSSMSVELDSDDKFLLSLSPALKRLNAKKNFLARIKIQQLLYEIEFDEKYDQHS